MSFAAICEFTELLPDGVLFVNEQGRIVHANAMLCDMLNYDETALLGQPLSILVPEVLRSRHDYLVKQFFHGHERNLAMANRSILQAQAANGEEVSVSISLAKVRENGQTLMSAIVHEMPSEMSDYKLQAETDHLTGIANRLYLSQRMELMLARRERFGLLYLDLNHFKPINDTYGHHVGDEVLKVVVARIQEVIRADDLVARVGGDEFVVLLKGVSSHDVLEPIAEKINARIEARIQFDDFDGRVGVAIGCVNSPLDGVGEKQLLERADLAMYEAKLGGEHYRFYSPEADGATGARSAS